MSSNTSNAPGLDPAVELGLSTSMVCHYLINAFYGIVSRIELMAMDGLDPAKVRELSQTIVESATTASQVARGLSDRASLLGAPKKEPLALGPIVEAAVARARAASGASISWSTSLRPVPLVLGDPDLLAELLAMGLRNAVDELTDTTGPKQNKKTIRVDLYVAEGDDRVTVDVTDSGEPIAQNVQGRAFEPFFTTKPEHEGLGLTLAKSIARRHNGFMSIKPAQGGGTILRLTLPAMPQDAATLAHVVPGP